MLNRIDTVVTSEWCIRNLMKKSLVEFLKHINGLVFNHQFFTATVLLQDLCVLVETALKDCTFVFLSPFYKAEIWQYVRGSLLMTRE